MSSLNYGEKAQLEKLLMRSGYVSDFTDRTFGEFFEDTAKIDIHSEKYRSDGTSKANKLRAFWKHEQDNLVGKVLLALVEHEEECISDEANMILAQKCKDIAKRLLTSKMNLDPLKKAMPFDARHITDQIRRMEESIENDPSLAIGTAKEFIESCCKTILAERDKPVSGSPDFPTLIRQTLKELELTPDDIPDATRGNEVIKRLLQNLSTIGNNLSELRNLYGTGHGKHGKAKGLTTRHAKLAVGAASTLITFLFDTHMESKK